MPDVRFAVRRYIAEGWSVVPIPRGEKGPRVPNWQKTKFTETAFGENDNVGVRLGRPSGQLIDVDLDDLRSLPIAAAILPATKRVHGRPSKPRSHYFYKATDDLKPESFKGLEKETLVEIRGTGQQTVLPPSVHPSGETLAWDDDGEPMPITPSDLRQLVVAIAAATFLSKIWPKNGPTTNQHDLAGYVAGYLIARELPAPLVAKIVACAATAAGDDNVADRERFARDTCAKFRNGDKTQGGTKLQEEIGSEAAQILFGWFDDQVERADKLIAQLNERYFLVGVGSETAVGEEVDDAFVLRSFNQFKQHLVKAPLVKVKKAWERLPDAWLRAPKGRQYDRLIYAPPGCSQKIRERDLNGWRGFRVEPRAGGWDLNRAHVEQVICAGDPEVTRWVLDWCAALVQEPGRHAETSLVILGGQGTGKGHFVDQMLGSLFDRHHYATVIDRKRIFGDFNELLSGRALIFLDESTWGGDKKDAGIIKGLITGHEITVTRKYLPAVVEPSLLHLVIASNEDWPVGIDKDDRRFCVLQVAPLHANDQPYFTALHRELAAGGREAMLHDLLHRPFDRDVLRLTPKTQAKVDLKIRTLDPDLRWWYERLIAGQVIETDEEWPVVIRCADLFEAYLREATRLRFRRISSAEEVGAFLRRLVPGLKKHRLNRDGGRPWAYELPALAECREAFDEAMMERTEWPEEPESKAQRKVLGGSEPRTEDIPF